MAIEDRSPLHTFADRALRDSLRYPEHLRALLQRVRPDLAEHLIFERMREVGREFLLEDWRSRETDVIYEIPYRLDDGTERVAIVCILIEHQTATDRLMPLRIFLDEAFYWDRQWREHAEQSSQGEELRLRPVLPIVLYTGPRPWGSSTSLADLMGPPDAFHMFTPVCPMVIWSLADDGIEDLLGSDSEWMRMLAIVRAEPEDAETFQDVLTRVTRSLETVYRSSRPRWYDLMRICLTWAAWRRPAEERARVRQLTESIQDELDLKKELDNMANTIAEEIYEEGTVGGLRESVLLLGTEQWQAPSQEIRERIEALKDKQRLRALLKQVLTASGWEDLLVEGQ